ncbi:hypothetical protein MKK84_15940 [Methylobacterium sp. E-065]|uniref:hypothetical protein n=1 Tax=Methylobacterium sp. E-065 TaxID=2836583 RepID=UPI001FBB87F7|nr:hypothetical protein [Methylobacterium sp. E-065]MCJ2018915.1 hypothetical protein [Methylobacterium sp. E-065]
MWPDTYLELRAVYGEAERLSGEIRCALGLRSERAVALAAEEAELAGRYRRVVPHESRGVTDLTADCKARIARLQANPDLPPEMRPGGR